MGGAQVIGPILVGLEKSVQIVRLGATVNDLLNMAALGATRLRELNPLIGATLAAAACGVGREPKSGIARQ